MARYGPHRDEDTPPTVTVLPAGPYPVERQEPIPRALMKQRRRMNELANEREGA